MGEREGGRLGWVCGRQSDAYKALLHCAIFSTTCLAMLKIATLQVAEVECYRLQCELTRSNLALGWAGRE